MDGKFHIHGNPGHHIVANSAIDALSFVWDDLTCLPYGTPSTGYDMPADPIS